MADISIDDDLLDLDTLSILSSRSGKSSSDALDTESQSTVTINSVDEEEQVLNTRSIYASSDASDDPLPRLSDYPEDYWVTTVFPADEGMRFELITAMHDKVTSTWKASPMYESCCKAIEETVLKQEKLIVTNCICSATTSFTRIKTELLESPLGLVVVFESCVAQLSTRYPVLVVWYSKLNNTAGTRYDIQNVYFEKTYLNELDEEFLTSRGYQVIEQKELDTYITESTMLFTPWIRYHVQQSCLAAAFPAIHIAPQLSLRGVYYVPPSTHLLK